MTKIHKNADDHPDLIGETRSRLQKAGAHWVIENVVGAPLIDPVMLCGTMFGLRIPKHRLFEASFELPHLLPPCNHHNVYDPYHGGEDARGESEKLSKITGIDWFMTRKEVREAIPPAYSEWIGCALNGGDTQRRKK